MTFRELLEGYGLDVEELMKTEVGQHKSGQTFFINSHIHAESFGEPGRVELMITALKYDPMEKK